MSGLSAIWRDEAGSPERFAATLATLTHALCLDSEQSMTRTAETTGVGISSCSSNRQIHLDEQVLIACDADLDNEDDLTALVRVSSSGGTEVTTAGLMAVLYERFGEGFPEKLSGAFSVIIWDRVRRQFLAAIDHLGLNRLVYYSDGHSLLVASRVDAFASIDGIDLSVNPRAIANILNFTTNLAPETAFTRIKRLNPGTMLIASNGGIRHKPYWDMRYDPHTQTSEDRLAKELEEVVEQAVSVTCGKNSLEHTGAFLSGGTDSSTVVGLMARRAKGPVHAFSIGFKEQPFNEMAYAELAAKRFGAHHHTYYVSPQDCFEALPRMVRFFDEPFGNSSAIATYFCARLAAQHGVTLLLAGDGGDELFGGNERYRTDKIFESYKIVPGFLRKGLVEPVLSVMPQSGFFRRAQGYVRRANLPAMQRFSSFQFLASHPLAEIFEPGFLEAMGGYSFLDVPSSHYETIAADHLDRLLYVDLKITLADSDLPKVTYMSEMAGIRTRFPFLHRSVVNFSGKIPPRLKVKGLEKRYLFKQAFRNLLPAEIIRKTKHGFGIPVADWIRSDPRMRELARDVLMSQRASQRGYFRQPFIEELFRRHEADTSSYYGDTLWTFLTLELWHRRVVDQVARVSS